MISRFHLKVDQSKYRARPIARAEISFFDNDGNKLSTHGVNIAPYNGAQWATDDTSETQEHLFKTRAAEKFRDALYKMGMAD